MLWLSGLSYIFVGCPWWSLTDGEDRSRMWTDLARNCLSYILGRLLLAFLHHSHQYPHTSYHNCKLNALIIVAVKTKNQVRTKSNIALACLSSTDAVYGKWSVCLFFIFWLIVELQGNTSGSYCVLISFSRASFRLLGITSLLHLAKLNAVEQYIAVKHSLCYEITVTEARLSGVSSLLWTITLLSTFLTNNNKYVRFDFGLTFLCVASIFSCQVVLFYETRRHKKKIAGQQVSVEAREKFLREKNALN